MLGRSVVCPDCGNRTEVPFQSDPRAEALYLRMKESRHGQAPSEHSTQLPSSAQQSSLTPQNRSGLPHSVPMQTTTPLPAKLSSVEIEQVDAWIERLWTDVPDSGVVAETGHYRSPLRNEADEVSVGEQSADSVFIRTLWHDPAALRLMVVAFTVVFLVGLGCGFTVQPLFFSGHSNAQLARPDSAVTVQGKLTFETPDNVLKPDVDAVVIFLPITRTPIVHLNGRSLRPRDGTESMMSEPSDVIQQIEELGGKYVHTDAEGKFSFSVDAEDQYLGILISSHVIRPEDAKWNAEMDRKMRRFFREPAELMGDYQFRCDEYELKRGETLSVQHNFAR